MFSLKCALLIFCHAFLLFVEICASWKSSFLQLTCAFVTSSVFGSLLNETLAIGALEPLILPFSRFHDWRLEVWERARQTRRSATMASSTGTLIIFTILGPFNKKKPPALHVALFVAVTRRRSCWWFFYNAASTHQYLSPLWWCFDSSLQWLHHHNLHQLVFGDFSSPWSLLGNHHNLHQLVFGSTNWCSRPPKPDWQEGGGKISLVQFCSIAQIIALSYNNISQFCTKHYIFTQTSHNLTRMIILCYY